ncbi:MAG: gluconate 2-dehydrogenase subunit 3 family protein [Sphingomicrobium sp.]
MTQLDRRSLIRNAILLVGGSLAANPAAALAKVAAKAPKFFTPAQLSVLTTVVDIMIPRTDTPGAKDAGVPQAFDALMSNWASAQHQAQYRSVVEEFGGAGLMKLKPAERVALVTKMDAEMIGAWDPAYVGFKELVMTLYYLSETGATKELRYELVPGSWDAWTDVTPETRAWAV